MFVDALKRYLLIVWNFFFGQVSTESIQDSPKEQHSDGPADTVPPVEVQTNGDDILNSDDIEDITDDDEEEDYEEDEEVDDDESEEVIVPKKPEEKIVVSDVPAKADQKLEEVKVPEVPKPKDEIKKPELPKINDDKEKENKKVDSDKTAKKIDASNLDPDFEVVERETPKVLPKMKPEFEVVEREAPKVVPKPSADFEVIEREAPAKVVPEKKEDVPKSKPELQLPEKETPKVVVPEKKEDAPKSKPEVPVPEKEPSKVVVPEKKEDAPKLKPETEVAGKVVHPGIVSPEKAGDATPEKVKDVTPSPQKDDVKTLPEKAKSHVKFDDKKDVATESKTVGPSSPADANSQFVASEKGDDAKDTAQNSAASIDSFLSGEQRHAAQTPQNHQHQESILDQQLDYSDSGEELSDDDIEIDYEDDDDDDDGDENVVEVKPLPPVARSVYKKND